MIAVREDAKMSQTLTEGKLQGGGVRRELIAGAVTDSRVDKSQLLTEGPADPGSGDSQDRRARHPEQGLVQ